MPRRTDSTSCVVLSPGETFAGKQRLRYFAGISAESAGARGICMHLVTLPPGARSEPHLHERHETAIYVLSGEGGMYFGRGLRRHLTARAGQFLFIPANMPHLTYNASATTPCTAVLARTDPREQESVKAYAGARRPPTPTATSGDGRPPRRGSRARATPPSRRAPRAVRTRRPRGRPGR